MFTGIVEEVGTVREVSPGRMVFNAKIVTRDTRSGDSIAVSAVRPWLRVKTGIDHAPHSWSIDCADPLVKMAKELKANNDRHNRLGLSVAEAAFYDAIAQNEASVLQMGDQTLKKISVDLVWAVQQSATIDWSLKESVRAAMRSKVRRLLAKYGYPPDLEARAVELVLEQAEVFAASVAPERR